MRTNTYNNTYNLRDFQCKQKVWRIFNVSSKYDAFLHSQLRNLGWPYFKVILMYDRHPMVKRGWLSRDIYVQCLKSQNHKATTAVGTFKILFLGFPLQFLTLHCRFTDFHSQITLLNNLCVPAIFGTSLRPFVLVVTLLYLSLIHI